MKLKGKMVGMGAIALLALTALYAVVLSSSRMATQKVAAAEARRNQLKTVEALQSSQQKILLEAMDAIIKRDTGRVAPELVSAINAHARAFQKLLPILQSQSSTPEAKRLATSVADQANWLINGIQVDLVQLIEQSGAQRAQIERAFATMDDQLDEHSEALTQSFDALEAALNTLLAETGDARRTALLAGEVELSVVQVQQWLTDISATRGRDGLTDGLDEAEKSAKKFRSTLAKLKTIQPSSAKLLDQVAASFELYYEKGQWMAGEYIEGGPEAGNKAMKEFDTFATNLGEKVRALQTEMNEKAALADRYANHLATMKSTHRALETLMLAAMDSRKCPP